MTFLAAAFVALLVLLIVVLVVVVIAILVVVRPFKELAATTARTVWSIVIVLVLVTLLVSAEAVAITALVTVGRLVILVVCLVALVEPATALVPATAVKSVLVILLIAFELVFLFISVLIVSKVLLVLVGAVHKTTVIVRLSLILLVRFHLISYFSYSLGFVVFWSRLRLPVFDFDCVLLLFRVSWLLRSAVGLAGVASGVAMLGLLWVLLGLRFLLSAGVFATTRICVLNVDALTLSIVAAASAGGLGSLFFFLHLSKVAVMAPLSLGVAALVARCVSIALVRFSVAHAVFVLASALGLLAEPFGPLTTFLHSYVY